MMIMLWNLYYYNPDTKYLKVEMTQLCSNMVLMLPETLDINIIVLR